MDKEQFYPTPSSLAERMWKTFSNRSYLHSDHPVLEPSAGTGDIIKAMPGVVRHYSPPSVDACEIDPERLDILSKTNNITIVGHDFLDFEPARLYTHIIMNPPFRVGAKHLIHAWQIVQNAEIVCLLNAETLKNPNTKDRQYIAELVAQHGTVEYVQDAFLSPETQRSTTVECALIWLKKETPVTHSYLEGLALDDETFTFKPLSGDATELTIPDNVIETAVKVYQAARRVLYRKVESDAVLACEYARWSSILGGSLLESNHEKSQRVTLQAADRSVDQKKVQATFNKEHDALKEKAWHYMLSGIKFYDQLSTAASKTFQAEYKKVAQLEFTETNIHGFLRGVALQRTRMTDEMMLDIFDRFTEHYTDNRAYYRAWQSNAKHRAAAWRIKMTRIIIPVCCNKWGNYIERDAQEALGDIDKSFAALDSKHTEDTYGLLQAALDNPIEYAGRHSSDYFEFRYYPGAQTVHLYPKRKDLIDRLNRTVGRIRQWLPDEPEAVTDDFWTQYAMAEKVTGKMCIDTQGLNYGQRAHDSPEYMERVEQAHADACETLAIPLGHLLTNARDGEQPSVKQLPCHDI